MPTTSQICKLIEEGLEFRNLTGIAENVELNHVNKVTYAFATPTVICIGIIGDLLTVATLTQPNLQKGSIVYTYLTLLAITDLVIQLSIIPMIPWFLELPVCSQAAAFYYAHIGFPLTNSLMGASVWIVVFLTLNQFMAVCRPFSHQLRSRKTCFLLVGIAYIINFCAYSPWVFENRIFNFHISSPEESCDYWVCDASLKTDKWYLVYGYIRELIIRVLPLFLIIFFYVKILITYKTMKKKRLRMSASQKQQSNEKNQQEERRLFVLLSIIVIVFIVCTIPAAPLTIWVTDDLSQNLPFQIFRAMTNLLEFTKFSMNFYLYCFVNPKIRGICVDLLMCRRGTRTKQENSRRTPIVSQTTSFNE